MRDKIPSIVTMEPLDHPFLNKWGRKYSEKENAKAQLPQGTLFYGTEEVSGPLERTGTRVVAWNTDAFVYCPDNISLYQSHPWVLAVLPNGEALGVLADKTWRCEVLICCKNHI